MGLGIYMTKEFIKEIGNKSREFFEFVSPPVDIVEDGNELVVIADVPGFEKKDITLRINDNTLSISATREPVEHTGSSYYKQRPLRVEKKIHLPIKIKEGEESLGKATYENGVIEIRIPISDVGSITIQ
ncbi:MAG: heat-shock protein Hsp20 [Thaumarchaeota archaeon]|nr:heat-shock protein Hsp20 [Nitrososphaerota archaeon]|tara:strand:- start:4105 stop:4491 length:387 start_codon:yes stop_codon:yes gene_type:complete